MAYNSYNNGQYGFGGFLNRFPPVTRNILLINIVMYIATMINQNFMISTFAMFYPASPLFRIWQPVTYLFMHGHTLMDNVVMVVLTGVCEKLRQMSIAKIVSSSKEGVALKNEMSNYTNTLRSIRDVLLDNENYTSCPLYKLLKADIQQYIDRTIAALRHE